MDGEPTEYEAMPLAVLEHLADEGDAGAQQALDAFSAEIQERFMRPLAAFVEDPSIAFPRVEAIPESARAEMEEGIRQAQESRAAEVARDEAMVANLAATREAVEQSAKITVAALQRAEAAEAREEKRRKLAERREWAVAALAVVAIIVTILVA